MSYEQDTESGAKTKNFREIEKLPYAVAPVLKYSSTNANEKLSDMVIYQGLGEFNSEWYLTLSYKAVLLDKAEQVHVYHSTAFAIRHILYWWFGKEVYTTFFPRYRKSLYTNVSTRRTLRQLYIQIDKYLGISPLGGEYLCDRFRINSHLVQTDNVENKM